MLKLLIADDEPLVQIGLRSMLRWEEHGIEICGAVGNGEEALELIEKERPDIVITDINMPRKNGLEVARLCRERYGDLPVFIILTGYDEFSLAREAVSCQVFEYLVKIDLTAEVLAGTIARALTRVEKLRESGAFPVSAQGMNMQLFRDKFFIRLFHSLFENEQQYEFQRLELGIDFSAAAYAVCYCEILSAKSESMDAEKLVTLYMNTIHLVRETVLKYMPCYVTSLDMRHFNITFCLGADWAGDGCTKLKAILRQVFRIVHDYFSVQIVCAVGSRVASPLMISESYHDARYILSGANRDDPILLFEEPAPGTKEKKVFHMSLFRQDISKAFEELDTEALHRIVTQISDCFRERPEYHVQAMDAACNLLYLAVSLLPDGERTVAQIFRELPGGYRSIYMKTGTQDIVKWMLTLRDGLREVLEARRGSYKTRVVASVQEYIRAHVDKKLTLNEVAAVFGFSPNYLSQLFAKYCSVSFTEYIAESKIAAAKKLMEGGNVKVYEIAGKLGFESAFYFSKVFKKVEGCSPREYVQKRFTG